MQVPNVRGQHYPNSSSQSPDLWDADSHAHPTGTPSKGPDVPERTPRGQSAPVSNRVPEAVRCSGPPAWEWCYCCVQDGVEVSRGIAFCEMMQSPRGWVRFLCGNAVSAVGIAMLWA